MMEKGKSSLLRLVEEKAISREVIENEKRKPQENLIIPYLPKDCISNILVRLPIESLPQLRFICKPWYKIINSPTFIDAHFRSSNTVLIFLHIVGRDISLPSRGKSNLFPVESKLLQPEGPFGLRKSMFDPLLLYSINFIEITGQKGMVKEYNATCLGHIRASYNGLILLDNEIKKGGLIIVNPVTREAIDLPVGTMFPSGKESYGLTFHSHGNDYKVVHLFQDHLRYVGCEILDLSTRRWRMVDGPPFNFFNWLGCEPVFANEALYWLPRVVLNDYLVYFALDDEKFHKLPLPKSCSSDDSIFRMAGQLGLVTHEEPYRIVLWTLSSSCIEGWKKQYNITVDCRHVIPLYCIEETDEFVFTDTIGSLYSYDLYLHYTKKIEVKNVSSAVHGRYLPHVNSLLSWGTRPKDRYMDD
ncbi:hypothetical protein LIER_38222 [Lithospermum erythrorhizon]|uniref:F-box domain-containing protein n=1 Tax=Lithospermum erythrorhizon TaxID=34254 RepID=A0AAV3PYL6_LITER